MANGSLTPTTGTRHAEKVNAGWSRRHILSSLTDPVSMEKSCEWISMKGTREYEITLVPRSLLVPKLPIECFSAGRDETQKRLNETVE
jgi:hypothetical protein